MSIVNSLLDLAKKYVWANPYEDKQYLIGLNRLTKLRGVRNELIIPHVDVLMPTSVTSYVCYEMGSEVLDKLGIRDHVPISGWVALSEIMNEGYCHISLVTEGRLLTLSSSYLRRLPNGNVLIAVNLVQSAFGLKFDQRVYIRFYSFRENAGVGYTSFTKTPSNSAAYTAWRSGLAAAPGHWRVFKQGLLMDVGLIGFSDLQVGEVIQAYEDTNSILSGGLTPEVEVAHYPVDLNSMTSYDSVNGGRRKVICALDEKVDDNVNHDDVDFFIDVKAEEDDKWRGLYIARLDKHTVCPLTLKDIALDAVYLEHLISTWENDSGLTRAETRITYILRRVSRYVKPVNDVARIRDLSKLPEVERHKALAGLLATLPFWNANALEVSAFNRWRNARLATLNVDNLPDVFSRGSAINQLQAVQWDERINRHRYPYTAGDIGGRVVYYQFIDSGDMPGWTRPTSTGMMEAFWPNATNLAGDVINPLIESLEPITYALFLPDKNNDLPLDIERLAGDNSVVSIPNGQDLFLYYDDGDGLVKATSDDYTLVDSGGVYTITWSEDLLYANRWVRTAAKRIELRRSGLDAVQLISGINIYEDESVSSGIKRDIGMGVGLCWLNGKFMVEGIDYFVAKNDPTDPEDIDRRIFIVHCGIHLMTSGNCLEFVYMGLPDDSMTHVNKSRTGFVLDGKIGYDNRYDVYGDRMEIIHAGGNYIEVPLMLQEHNSVEYASLPPQPTPTTPAVYNGKPFSVTPIPSVLPEWQLEELCETKDEAIARDALVENYLSVIYPQDDSATTVVTDLYDLYSPLINAVTADIKSGYIWAPYSNPSDTWVRDLVNTYYTSYLNIEPSRVDSTIGYVEIRPRILTTVTSISSNGLTLLKRINELYCNNRVVGFETYYEIGEDESPPV